MPIVRIQQDILMLYTWYQLVFLETLNRMYSIYFKKRMFLTFPMCLEVGHQEGTTVSQPCCRCNPDNS